MERIEGIIEQSRALHGASLTALAVNAPAELAKEEQRLWHRVTRPEMGPQDVQATAEQMLMDLAYIERVNRRMRKASGN